MKRTVRIEVNTEVLNKYLKSKNMTYVQLADRAGLSTAKAFYLTKGNPNAGGVALGALATLNIPGLFQLVTYEKQNGKTRKVSIQNLIIKIGEKHGND